MPTGSVLLQQPFHQPGWLELVWTFTIIVLSCCCQTCFFIEVCHN